MADFEHCNLCGVQLRSLTTHAVGEFFFCRDCYSAIVFPFVNLSVRTFVEAISGNKDAQQDFAESFTPGAKSRVVIGFGRIGESGERIGTSARSQATESRRAEGERQSDTVIAREEGHTASEGQKASQQGPAEIKWDIFP